MHMGKEREDVVSGLGLPDGVSCLTMMRCAELPGPGLTYMNSYTQLRYCIASHTYLEWWKPSEYALFKDTDLSFSRAAHCRCLELRSDRQVPPPGFTPDVPQVDEAFRKEQWTSDEAG